MLSKCNWVSTIQYCLLMVDYRLTIFGRLGSYATHMERCIRVAAPPPPPDKGAATRRLDVYIPPWTIEISV